MTEAEKEFERADKINAKKRAEELQRWAGMYKDAVASVVFAKTQLKSVVDRAKDAGFAKDVLDAVLTAVFAKGVDKVVFLQAITCDTNCDISKETED